MTSSAPDLLEDATLELLLDGWQVNGPNLQHPVPLTVPEAYKASGYAQDVLDETRHLCGTLRVSYRHSKKHQSTLARLRKELAQARRIKEERSGTSPRA